MISDAGKSWSHGEGSCLTVGLVCYVTLAASTFHSPDVAARDVVSSCNVEFLPPPRDHDFAALASACLSLQHAVLQSCQTLAVFWSWCTAVHCQAVTCLDD